MFGKYCKVFGDESKGFYEAKQIGLSVLMQLEFLQEYRNEIIFNELELYKIKEVLRVSKLEMKKWHSWKYLFSGKSLSEIVNEINSVWLDPDYKLVIETVHTQKVTAVLISK